MSRPNKRYVKRMADKAKEQAIAAKLRNDKPVVITNPVPIQLYTQLPQKGKDARQAIRKLVEDVLGPIERPTRVERLPVRDPDEDESILRIRKIGACIWTYLYTDLGGKGRAHYKIQYYPNASKAKKQPSWTCSCKGYQKKVGLDCAHILKVKKFEYLETDISTARRRPETVWLYPEGSPCESTRRDRAYKAMPTLVPQLLHQLATLFIDEPQPKGKCGAKGLSRKYGFTALLLKIFNDEGYKEVIARLGDLPEEQRLELGWMKPEPASERALIYRFGQGDFILPWLWKLSAVSARPGREFAEILVGDSHDMPGVNVANSRDRKSGVRVPSYRSDRPMVRHHFGMGAITGLIYASEFTLTTGLGAHDAAHLPSLVEAAKAVMDGSTDETKLTQVAFDKAYGPKRNYRRCEEMGVDLYVAEKINEDRLKGDFPESAKRLTKMERDRDPRHRNVSRRRNRAEGGPSVIKGRNRRRRFRGRKSDKTIPYPDNLPKDVHINDLPEDVIAECLAAALSEVGVARLSEMLAMVIIHNLCALVMLSFLCDDTIDFENDRYIRPPELLSEEQLVESQKHAA